VITSEPAPATTFGGSSQPQLSEGYLSQPRSTEKPANSGEAEPEPDPANTNGGAAEETQDNTSGGSGALLEAPELFGPNGRTAKRSVAPVRTAVYEQPVSQRRVSSAMPRRVTAEQAARDAVGWRSPSN
jgi:hypothetical protein